MPMDREQETYARRGFLKGLGALPVIAGGVTLTGTTLSGAAGAAVPLALASTPHPDAELLALGERLEEMSKALLAAEDEADRLHEVYLEQLPPCPEALIWKPSDPGSGFLPLRDKEGRRVWGFEQKIDRLRRFEGRGYMSAGDREHAVKRAKEIVEAYDSWSEAKAQIRDRIGYTEAVNRSEALFHQVRSLGEAIARLPAQTLAGLIVKARAVEIFNSGVRDGDLRDDPTSDVLVAGAIVRDLLAMQVGRV